MIFKDIKTPKELMRFFEKNLRYGFVYRNKIFLENEPNFDDDFNKYYKVRLGRDFIKTGYGVCWDFCELERAFFEEKGIEHECYFLESFTNRAESGPTHTFAIFKQGVKWNWFEYSWFAERGIHTYSSKLEAIKDVFNKCVKVYGCNVEDARVYKTSKITTRLDAFEFVEHCIKGEKIDIKKLVESENRKV